MKAGVGNNDLIGLNFGGEKTLTVKRCSVLLSSVAFWSALYLRDRWLHVL